MGDRPAEQLWRGMHDEVAPFPDGVEEVPEAISGTAFFPGGLGLWLPEGGAPAPFPNGQIMVVGQDFNSKSSYEKALRCGTEVDISPTWRVLQEMLPASGVSLARCFFTNVYMGLRKEGRETGRFPGTRDKNFVARCVKFFGRQLEVAQPKLILTLGVEPFQVLGTHLFHIPVPKTLTAAEDIYPVSLDYGDVTVVALTHPSFYRANVWRRKYGQLTGSAAETAMIQDGLARAF